MQRRDLLDLMSLTPEQVAWLIARAARYKKGEVSRCLAGKSVGLFFEKVSTRTRVAFEVAIARLGGHPLFLSLGDIQIKRGETIADTARVLSGYLDALVIRTHGHDKLEQWARYATVPIINGLTDLHHPCQGLCDLLTIYERRGNLKGLKLAYIGDGNNVVHSLIEGGILMGMAVVVASPKGFGPSEKIVQRARELAKQTGGTLEVIDDPKAAASQADVLYTDVWVSMGQEDEEKKRKKIFKDYRVDARLLHLARQDCMVMHCLPAHRGEEITDEVMEGPHSVIFEQASNRLPMHQAILELCVQGGS